MNDSGRLESFETDYGFA
jgi:hypothetical protein